MPVFFSFILIDMQLLLLQSFDDALLIQNVSVGFVSAAGLDGGEGLEWSFGVGVFVLKEEVVGVAHPCKPPLILKNGIIDVGCLVGRHHG